MALEATHIRFALDLKDKYRVTELDKYLSGAIYPDSRYVTGIDRNLTHSDAFTHEAFYLNDDFKKGWAAHLLCDKIQYEVTKELLPQIFIGTKGQGSETWIAHTAVKIILDLDDCKKFDVKKYLPFLDYIQTPNGENPEQIKSYNQIFQKMYLAAPDLPADSLMEMWIKLGVEENILAKVRAKTLEYSNSQKTMDAIRTIYGELISTAK